MIRTLHSCVLVSFLLAAGEHPGATAASGAEVEVLIKEGISFMAARDYVAAMDAFRRAHEIAPSARTFAQIGFVYMATRRWVEAEDQFLQAIADGKDKWAQRNREVLAESLTRARQHLGFVEITGQPAEAEIRIDGELVGVLPMRRPMRFEARSVMVTVTSPGFKRFESSTQVPVGATTRIEVSLERVPAPLARLSVGEPRPATPLVVAAIPREPPPDRSRSSVRILATLLVVSGLASLAGGTVSALANGSDSLSAGMLAGGGAALLMGGAFFLTASIDEAHAATARSTPLRF
jgi:hypothetical protein